MPWRGRSSGSDHRIEYRRGAARRSQIYPTENYYYFRFALKGVPYAGNIRLAVADRDKGRVHFAYRVAPTDRRPEPKVRHVALDATRGVSVEKRSSAEYRVSYSGKTVTFLLNDLSAVKPPDGLLRLDETFLGAIFDESAIRLFLVFNPRLRIFRYLFDETMAGDEWVDTVEEIAIGKCTGFAFHRDGERKFLVGVLGRNSRLNTAFDGPFDRSPENSVEGEALRDAIVAADPAAKGKIDRLGHYLDGSGRYLIHPFLLYRAPAILPCFIAV